MHGEGNPLSWQQRDYLAGPTIWPLQWQMPRLSAESASSHASFIDSSVHRRCAIPTTPQRPTHNKDDVHIVSRCHVPLDCRLRHAAMICVRRVEVEVDSCAPALYSER